MVLCCASNLHGPKGLDVEPPLFLAPEAALARRQRIEKRRGFIVGGLSQHGLGERRRCRVGRRALCSVAAAREIGARRRKI
jgi:hypothetical protein